MVEYYYVSALVIDYNYVDGLCFRRAVGDCFLSTLKKIDINIGNIATIHYFVNLFLIDFAIKGTDGHEK